LASCDRCPRSHSESIGDVTRQINRPAIKQDTRTLEEVAASPGNGYNAPDAHLDPETVRTILDWLEVVFGEQA
jgi:hypothetical protein